MTKYRCKICGYINEITHDDFKQLSNDWACPNCGALKKVFSSYENVVKVSENNEAIEFSIERCIDCGLCKRICKKEEGLEFDEKSELCLSCGQCIQACPTNALKVKSDKDKLYEALFSNKICVACTAPAVRVSIAEALKQEVGSFEQNKLVGLLKMMGFDYVFDTATFADLTIMEETSELIERINSKKNLPMITSCCPSWVKYAEDCYPEILKNISTCKSPIGMQGAIISEYFTKQIKSDKNDIFTVAITPCTAKKAEIRRAEMYGTDLVITVLELIEIIKENNIIYGDIEEKEYDSMFSEGSTSGILFGNTGGVMISAIRTLHYMLTNENIDENKISFKEIPEITTAKEASIEINGNVFNFLIVHELSTAKPFLEEIKNGNSKYHFIEIMNCYGGCTGGGGQPKLDIRQEVELRQKRIEVLKEKDKNFKVRYCHDNENIKKLYRDLLKQPLSEVSMNLLHIDRNKKGI